MSIHISPSHALSFHTGLWSYPSEESTATLSCTPRMNFNETLVGATGDSGSQDPRGSRCG